jgi:succinoglycan biosynthesis transport protein ExoP
LRSFPTVPQSEPGLPPEPEFELNIGEYIGMFRRHWKLVAAVCLLCVGAGALHYSITPKAYLATATLQIERRGLSPVLGNANPWLENYWNLEFYPTQYELLKSRGLAERVVKHLDLMNDPEFNPGGASPEAARNPDPAVRAGGTAAAVAVPTSEDDEAVLGQLAERLRGGLAVEPVRNTQLVQISYRSGSRDFAAKVANGFVEAFIDMGVESRFSNAGKASSFLGSQIESLKQEIDDKEKKLQAFSRRSDIVTLDPSSNVTLQRLEGLNASYIEAKKARIQKESEYREILTAPRETVADTLAEGVVSTMRADQLRLERDYETKLKTYKPDWPAMVELKTQIEKGQQHLDGVIAEMVSTAQKGAYASFLTAQRQEHSLAAELETLKGDAMDQSSDAVEYTNLQTEIKTRRGLLDELLRSQSETEVTARLQDTRDSNVHIIDHALVPGGAFYPSLRKDATTGLLIGFLLSAALVLVIEFLDRTLKTPEEVERRLGLSTLAVIPDLTEGSRSYGYFTRYGQSGQSYGYGGEEATGRVRPAGRKKGKGSPASWLEKKKSGPDGTQIELVPHERPRTPVSEAYRALRTALLLSSANELRVIAVTSAEAGEGKTTTSSNLAVVMAQLGRRVLIVDSDLRKPRLHQVFRVSNRLGLVTWLTSGGDPDGVFLPTEVPNLWLTPSGPIPPNPSELLASERMREWLRMVRSRFDVVIVDTPPALAVTDATILGVLADGVVLTLRAGKVTREEARLCRDRLRYAGIKILGVVLNRHRDNPAGRTRRYRYYEAYGVQEPETKTGSAA